MGIPPETIYNIAIKVSGVINSDDIASRGVVGRQVFIEMHLILDADDVEIADYITEEVESRKESKICSGKNFDSRRTVYL